MTARCGGGTSSVIPGVANNLVLATGAAGIFSLIPGLEWLVAVGSALGVLTYDLSTVCSTDPPAIPTFTPQEAIAFTTGAIGSSDFNSFVQKAHDLAAAIVWDKYCKCDSGAAPPPNNYPTTPPIGTLTNSTTNVCGTASFNGLVELDNVGFTDMFLGLPSAGLGGKVTQGAFTNIQTVRIPNGVTAIAWRARTDKSDTGNTNGAQAVIGFWSNTALIQTISPGSGTPQFNSDFTQTFTVPSGSVFYTLGGTTNHLVSSTKKNLSVQIQNVCGGTVIAPQTPCPSDPAVLALLNQILAILTLIQRQLVPFAYVAGAVHSNLSGSNSFVVSQLVGVKVELTTIPDYIGEEIGVPSELWNAGWIVWGSADGFEMREWITTSPMISLPRNAQVLNRFAYNLRPGVVARITELEREA